MKKLFFVIFSISIILSLAITVSAASVSCNVSTSTVNAGETITISVSTSAITVGSVGVSVNYDSSKFELVSGDWNISGGILSNFDLTKGNAAFAFEGTEEISGRIFSFVLKAKDSAGTGSVGVTVVYDGTSSASDSAKVTINPAPHNHTYGDWQKNDIQHWKECTLTNCAEKSQLGDHIYDNACDTSCNTCGYARTITHSYKNTYTTDSTSHWYECSVCGSKKDVTAHNYTEQNFDANNHWNECVCGAKDTAEAHKGGSATCAEKAICDICDQQYGSTSDHSLVNIVDNKYLKSEADCKNPAVYYKSCSVCKQAGTETFTSGTADESKHNYSTTYLKDADNHWYECSACGDKKDIAAHNYTELKYDANNHWNECVCGAKDTVEAHKGGSATCTSQAVCEVCSQLYGSGNHTSVFVPAKDATPDSNGNIAHYICTDCGKYFIDANCKIEIPYSSIIVIYKAPSICELYGHNMSVIDLDENSHVEYCLNGCGIVITSKHYFGLDYVCRTCGHVLETEETENDIIIEIEDPVEPSTEEEESTNVLEDQPKDDNPVTGITYSIIAIAICATAVVFNKKK